MNDQQKYKAGLVKVGAWVPQQYAIEWTLFAKAQSEAFVRSTRLDKNDSKGSELTPRTKSG